MGKNILVKLAFMVLLVVCIAQSGMKVPKPLNEPKCSYIIRTSLNSLLADPVVRTTDDSDGVSNVKCLDIEDICASCAMVEPYDTTVRRILLQFLAIENERYPAVRADAASEFPLLSETGHYDRDPEIADALIKAMRRDVSSTVRLEAAHTLISFCHRDTLEVMDTLISIAISNPMSSSDLKRPCPHCISNYTRLRRGAVMTLGAKEFYGIEKVVNTLNTLSADGDSTVSKSAEAELKRIQERQMKRGK
jgi:hypothetical protein